VPTVLGPNDDLPLGASRFNGSPDLPPNMGWPMWRGPNPDDPTLGALAGEGPLTFLAQIDLAALPPLRSSMLPTSGWLLLFADLDRSRFGPDDQEAHRVVHLPAGTAVERRVPPGGHEHYASTDDGAPHHRKIAGRGRPVSLGFDVVPSVPYDEIRRNIATAPQPGRAELEDLTLGFLGRDWHQVLGHPISVHQDVLATCDANWRQGEGRTDEPDLRDDPVDADDHWQLLFTIWDDGSVQDLLGGVFYVAIRTEDLLLRRFDRTVAVFQR
jgi:hypothetical protein